MITMRKTERKWSKKVKKSRFFSRIVIIPKINIFQSVMNSAIRRGQKYRTKNGANFWPNITRGRQRLVQTQTLTSRDLQGRGQFCRKWRRHFIGIRHVPWLSGKGWKRISKSDGRMPSESDSRNAGPGHWDLSIAIQNWYFARRSHITGIMKVSSKITQNPLGEKMYPIGPKRRQ